MRKNTSGTCPAGHPYTKGNIYKHGSYIRCRTCHRIKTDRRRAILKAEIITHYGGHCSWVGCEVRDPDMLAVDHINNDAAVERRRKRTKWNRSGWVSGINLYRQVKREGFPSKYQLLCANHNTKKEALRRRQEGIRVK